MLMLDVNGPLEFVTISSQYKNANTATINVIIWCPLLSNYTCTNIYLVNTKKKLQIDAYKVRINGIFANFVWLWKCRL